MDKKIYDEIRALITDEIAAYAFPGLFETLCENCQTLIFNEESTDSPDESFLEEVEMTLDPVTLEIIEKLDEIKRKYNVTDADLERIMGYSVKLSRLVIAHSGKMYLDDYGGVEVKMDSLCRAVYFLFLSHPEGIDYKSLPDYRDELGAFYYRYSGKERDENSERSLDMLCNSIESNSIHEKVSRIKRAFENVIEKRIAVHYCIVGKAGEPKSILLDRSLVQWD